MYLKDLPYWKDLPNVDANLGLVAGRAISFSKSTEKLLRAIVADDLQMDPSTRKKIENHIEECRFLRQEAQERFEKRNEPTITKQLSNPISNQ